MEKLMKVVFCLFTLLCFSWTLFAEPPRKIPSEITSEFTMGGKIPVIYWYLDNPSPNEGLQVMLKDGSKASFFSKKSIRKRKGAF
jgi:hypothetical protein